MTFVLADAVPGIPESFIEIESSIQEHFQKVIEQQEGSIYDQCLLALALGAEPLDEEIELESRRPRLKWGEDQTSLHKWGGILPGSYLRIDAFGEVGKLVVSTQKLLGLGSRKRGNSVIAAFIELSTEGKFEDKFQMISRHMRIYALSKSRENEDGGMNVEFHSAWTLLMLFSIACKICSTAGTEVALKRGQTNSANCWEEAFGELLALDLSNGFGFLGFLSLIRGKDQQKVGRLRSNFWPFSRGLIKLKTKLRGEDRLGLSPADTLADNFQLVHVQSHFKDNPQASNMIDVELSELMLAMGASRFTVFSGKTFVQGSTCIAVRLGVDAMKMPFWHILSTNEVQTLYSDSTRFLDAVEELCMEISLYPDHKSDPDVFEDSLVRVGHSLVMPEPCEEVLHLFEFVPLATGGKREARGEVTRKARKGLQGVLRWFQGPAEIEVQAEADLSFPGFNSKITSNWKKQANNDKVTEDHALADCVKTFKKSLATFVFVYEGLNGQVSEQNLYCIANAVAKSCCVLSTATDTGPPVLSVSTNRATEGGETIFVNGNTHARPEMKPRATPSALDDWLGELDRARQRLNRPESSPEFAWGRDIMATLKLCGRVLTSGSCLVEKGSIGGLDLVELLDHDRKERVYESPRNQPEWAKAPKLQTGLGVAVYELSKPPVVVKQDSMRKGRCGLIISIPGVERIFGRLLRAVEETTGITFTGISDDNRISIVLTGINDSLWPVIEPHAQSAAMMKWGAVYVPSDVRFGGQIAAALTCGQPVKLIRSEPRKPLRTLTDFALCEPGRREFVGLMLQFEGEVGDFSIDLTDRNLR